jgi:hypothetical protein
MNGPEPIQTNAADPEQIAVGRRAARDDARAQKARWRVQLSTAEGRQFVWDEIFGDGFLFEHIDTVEVQKLGVRNRMLKWWAFCQAHTSLFLQMQAEALKRADETQRRRRKERAGADAAP